MPDAALEFALSAADLPRLAKLPFLVRTGRAVPLTLMWHDTPDGGLAGQALSLSEQRGQWRLEGLHPSPERPWPAGSLAPLVAHGGSLASLNGALPGGVAADGLTPVAALRGRRLEFGLRPPASPAGPADAGLIVGAGAAEPAGASQEAAGPDAAASATQDVAPPVAPDAEPVRVTVLDGQLRGVASEQPACRVLLRGDAALLKPLALDLANAVRISVPRAGLAASAIAVARGTAPPPRFDGPPALPPGLRLTDSIALLVGQLLDTMLYWSAGAAAGATPVPVHQMRVATRRLRSAVAIFKRVAACPDMVPLNPALRDTAARLGGARDWDVFLGGTAERIAAAFPDDRRVRALLAAARRRRQAGYADLRAHLESAAFRELEVSLACAAVLRPWDRQPAPDPRLQQDTSVFAAIALDRQLKRVRHAGRGLATLPLEALHELRKDCKRLRYAAEFFLPLFPERPARRFVKRLAVLQEALGTLNDGAVAAGLMAHLGRAERSYAAGLVEGFVAAGTEASRSHIGEAWSKFRKTPAFWT